MALLVDFTKTYDLLMAVKQAAPVTTFLRDRYFPTGAGDIFDADEVLIDYMDEGRKVAPYVVPRKGSVTVMRDGYETKSYAPPYIAPDMILTFDELKKRNFGEALFSGMSPEQRQNIMIMADAEKLRTMIRRREEQMSSEVLQTSGCVMKHIADDTGKVEEREIHYYSGSSNPATYTPDVKWNASSGTPKILQDLAAMVRSLTKRGLPATDFVCSPDVADTMLRDDDIYKMLDNRRFELGSIQPIALPDGVTQRMVLDVDGRMIRVLSYDETYTDPITGTDKPFIASGTGIITAPACGRMAYARVYQMEADGLFHGYAERYVPKQVSDMDHNLRKLVMTSRPLPIPNNKTPWIAAKVLADA